MCGVNEIHELLSHNSDFRDQLHGIELVRQQQDLSPYVLPNIGSKSKLVWENCARALYELPDSRLEAHLPKLLEWTQDFNWPGALIILDRLKVFSGKKLRNQFLKLVDDAINMNSEEGLMWLDNLSELLDNEELKAELPKDILETLQKHYHDWGWWYEE